MPLEYKRKKNIQLLTWNKNKETTIILMEEKILIINNWLSGSRLKVNENKTELCLLNRKYTPPIEITINHATIKSHNVMNV